MRVLSHVWHIGYKYARAFGSPSLHSPVPQTATHMFHSGWNCLFTVITFLSVGARAAEGTAPSQSSYDVQLTDTVAEGMLT